MANNKKKPVKKTKSKPAKNKKPAKKTKVNIKKTVKKPTKKVAKKQAPVEKAKKSIPTEKVIKHIAAKKSTKTKATTKKTLKKVVKVVPTKKVAKKQAPIEKAKKSIPAKKVVKPIKLTKKEQDKEHKAKKLAAPVGAAGASIKITDFEFNDIIGALVAKAKPKANGKSSLSYAKIEEAFEKYILTDEHVSQLEQILVDEKIEVSGKSSNENDLDEGKPLEQLLSVKELNSLSKMSNKDKLNDTIKFLFSNVKASVVLSKEDEKFYAKLLKSTNDDERKYARNKLVFSNIRLVISQAKRYSNHGIDFEDLLQEGVIGLLKSIDKYDVDKGFAFSTYATWWVRQAITRINSDQGRIIRVPVHMNELYNEINKMDIKLSNQLGRSPSVKEISEALGGDKAGYSTKKISDLRKIYSNAANLDKSVKTDDDSHLEDFIKDDSYVSPKARIEKEMVNQEVRKLIQQNLTPDEEVIIFLKRGIALDKVVVDKYLINAYEVREYSYEEIAKILNCTKEKVRQIESKAIRKLKQPAKVATLQKFMNESSEN